MHAQTVDTRPYFFASRAFQCQKRGTGDEATPYLARSTAGAGVMSHYIYLVPPPPPPPPTHTHTAYLAQRARVILLLHDVYSPAPMG